MIARIWQARTGGEQPTNAYRQVFEEEVLGHLRGLTGFHGGYLLARPAAGSTEIMTVTLFDSLESIKSFAGDDFERERVTPAARATLLRSNPAIRHFTVLVAPDP